MFKKITGFTLAGTLALTTMLSGYAEITGSGFRSDDCTGMLYINLWMDTDGDGLRGRMESGISGADLIVSMTDFQDLGTEKFSSDATGMVEIDDLCSGRFTIDIDPNTLPRATGFDAAFEAGLLIIDGDVSPQIIVSLINDTDSLAPGARYIDLAFGPHTRGMK